MKKMKELEVLMEEILILKKVMMIYGFQDYQ